MSVPLPITAPFTAPIGQVYGGFGDNPPTSYAAGWYFAPNSPEGLIVNATDIVGVAGPAMLAYMQAQGIAFASLINTTMGLILGSSSGGPTQATATIFGTGGARTGTVNFHLDSVLNPPFASGPVVTNGVTQTITPIGSPGAHTIIAVYSGDSVHNACVSAPQPFDILLPATLVFDPPSAGFVVHGNVGSTATLTVLASGAGGPVTGNVLFQGQSQTFVSPPPPFTLGTAPVSGGQAQLVIDGTMFGFSGNFSLFAHYQGDSTYAAAFAQPSRTIAAT